MFNSKQIDALKKEVTELERNLVLSQKSEKVYRKIIEDLRKTSCYITPTLSNIKNDLLVLSEQDILRRIKVLNDSYILNVYIAKETFSVTVPSDFSKKYNNHPVTKEQLLEYLIEKNYKLCAFEEL